MRKSVTVSILTVSFLVLMASVLVAAGKDLKVQYCQVLATYHEEPFNTVMSLVGPDLTAEDVAVVMHMSERLHIAPEKVVAQHAESGTWMATAAKLGLSAIDFHVPGVNASGSKTFGPIYEKFRSTAASKWREIQLDDAEILNLVNLSLLLNYHRYDIDKILALRDDGVSFIEINASMSTNGEEKTEETKETKETTGE